MQNSEIPLQLKNLIIPLKKCFFAFIGFLLVGALDGLDCFLKANWKFWLLRIPKYETYFFLLIFYFYKISNLTPKSPLAHPRSSALCC